MRGTRVVFPEKERVEVEDFEVPGVGGQQVLIRSEISLISAGTELTTFLGGHGTERYPAYPGYSNVGIIEEVGAGVQDHRTGDRVLTMGQHASHCVIDLTPSSTGPGQYIQSVPDGVDPASASFAVLGSVAMHGVRKAEPQLKQSGAVIGQGVVGQLIAQFARLAGCYPIIGIDVIPLRLEKAIVSGTPIVINAAENDVAQGVLDATGGRGVDLAFDATRSPRTILTLMQIAALSGKVIIVGSIPGTAEVSLFDPLQTKELTIIGAWQPRSPVVGHAYFPWTQSRNRLSFLELVRDGQVKVEHLITHRLAATEAHAAYSMIREGSANWLAVVFQW